jgi:hypothetical protein
MAILASFSSGIPDLNDRVVQVESMHSANPLSLECRNQIIYDLKMFDRREKVAFQTEADEPVSLCEGNQTYWNGWLDAVTSDYLFSKFCADAQIDSLAMPERGPIRAGGTERFWRSNLDRNVACREIELGPTSVLLVSP